MFKNDLTTNSKIPLDPPKSKTEQYSPDTAKTLKKSQFAKLETK
jgi:hypothetical protein